MFVSNINIPIYFHISGHGLNCAFLPSTHSSNPIMSPSPPPHSVAVILLAVALAPAPTYQQQWPGFSWQQPSWDQQPLSSDHSRSRQQYQAAESGSASRGFFDSESSSRDHQNDFFGSDNSQYGSQHEGQYGSQQEHYRSSESSGGSYYGSGQRYREQPRGGPSISQVEHSYRHLSK